jgi:hypothetical protein
MDQNQWGWKMRDVSERRAWRWFAALPASVVLGVATGLVPAAAQFEGAVAFEASAAAEGVRIGVGSPGFLVVEQFFDVGAPVAQAVVDNLGTSQAFASHPYPGDLVIAGPGLFSGVTGLPNPGDYPFYVNSSYPTEPEAKLTQPGYELVARSDTQASESSASSGGTSGDSAVFAATARAAAKRDAASGVVTGEAVAAADGFNAGGVLRIGHVLARAKVTRSPAGEPQRESEFHAGLSIAGQAVGLSEGGLTAPGSTTPLPADNPLLQLLKENKITVSYLAAIHDSEGVVSPGLVVTHEQQVPGGPTLVFTYVFGRAVAHASVFGGSPTPESAGPVTPEDAPPASDTSPGASTNFPTDGVAPGASPETGAGMSLASPAVEGGAAGFGLDYVTSIPSEAPGAISDTVTGPLAGSGLTTGALRSDVPTAIAAPITRLQALASGSSMKGLYAILVLGAVLALSASFLVRRLGVRRP